VFGISLLPCVQCFRSESESEAEPKRGEVWVCLVGDICNAGDKPFLVLSKNQFNESDWGLVIAAPIDKEQLAPPDPWDATIGDYVVHCGQMRTLSISHRLYYKVHQLSDSEMNTLEQTLVNLLRAKQGMANIVPSMVGMGNEYHGDDKRIIFLASTQEFQTRTVLPAVPSRSNRNYIYSEVVIIPQEAGISNNSYVKCEDIRPVNKTTVEKPWNATYDLRPSSLRRIAVIHQHLLLCSEKV